MRTMKKSLLFLALLLPGLVHAGRPLSTEDASTLDDKACQLEAWVDRTRGGVTDTFIVPACAYFGAEFQFGAARNRAEGRYLTFGRAPRSFRE